MSFEPVLTNHVHEPNAFTLDFYLKNARGYEGLRKALTQQRPVLIEVRVGRMGRPAFFAPLKRLEKYGAR